MPLSAIHQYMDMLDRRQAEYRMMMGEAASVPYMDEEKHQEWYSTIQNKIDKPKAASASKLAEIGVRMIRVKGE